MSVIGTSGNRFIHSASLSSSPGRDHQYIGQFFYVFHRPNSYSEGHFQVTGRGGFHLYYLVFYVNLFLIGLQASVSLFHT